MSHDINTLENNTVSGVTFPSITRLAVPLKDWYDIFGHSCTFINDDTIVVIGGTRKSELTEQYMYWYNVNTGEWTQKMPTYGSGKRLSFHSTIHSHQPNKLILFGGKINGYSNEAFMYDMSTFIIIRIPLCACVTLTTCCF